MRSVSNRTRIGVLAALTAFSAVLSTGSAAAQTQLNGDWAPFDRCPVDAPAMLAADGIETIATCIASSSATGSITLGKSQVPTGNTDLQLGVVQRSDGTNTLVAPAGGALTADQATVPGGLLGLMCPSSVPFVSAICRQLTDNNLNRITATIEPAGAPRDFNMVAAFSTGEPILTIPVRIHLKNPFLGDKCYIGTTADPVLLRPQNLNAPSLSLQRFAADGTRDDEGEMGRYTFSGADQGDATFAVPGASGCGVAGLLDWAVNLKTGLPSASGKNSVKLDNTSTYFGSPYDPAGLAPNEGRKLSEFWHSAVR
ncbi:hypothetical protein G6W61_03120 [Streptomyces sp. KAI-26]|uniref:hypothetical protein n=1 Tax=Streptomyces TaxID=1883 RepID=UPI000DC6570A|nr:MULTISPECIES: hypothetical protein [Streptomyces]NUW19213.1 hypothetical protein [Streptomyces roseoviolaceus]ATY99191.1 hypothetical protein CVT27_29645 [Streptomyces cavourensis]MBH0245470.1 hypothetical protein [Streptomyces cavourensis]NUV80007.1 hypothetical protein [Streptomyces sp. CAI-155]NUV85226.1 hypothetical protein [Streptomyces sp. KAI-26]